MKSELIPNLDDEPLAVTTLYPDKDYFQGWDVAKKQKKDEIDELIGEKNLDIVGITHTDADGYGCEVMLRKAYPDKDVGVVTASEQGPHSLEQIGDYIANSVSDETPIFIMDLAPDADKGRKFIDPFRHHTANVTVVDHHEWKDEDMNQIEWVADVYHDVDKCATQIMYDEFVDDNDDSIEKLAELTADHDLWIKEQEEDSDALSDLTYSSEREEYVDLAMEHGVDVINTDIGEKIIEEARETRNKKTELAINRATYYEINGYKVAITYGSCNASDVGSKIYEGETDLVCVIYPNGNVSFRSSDEAPIARKVAIEMGGGGHKCAAGAKIKTIGNGVNYTTHWSTMGRSARESLLKVLRKTL